MRSRPELKKLPPIADLPLKEPFFRQSVSDDLAACAPAAVSVLGDMNILSNPSLALFCSLRCPGNLILETYEFVKGLGQAGPTIISGFHSPMERQCLEVLLRRKIPSVICAPRALRGMRIPAEWRLGIAEDRLLLLSPFVNNIRRATGLSADQRNRFVAALADRILIVHASPRGKIARFATQLAMTGKTMETFSSHDNQLLFDLGASCISGQRVP